MKFKVKIEFVIDTDHSQVFHNGSTTGEVVDSFNNGPGYDTSVREIEVSAKKYKCDCNDCYCNKSLE